MKSFLIVSSICILLLIGISLTLSFWQIPIPVSEKTLVIPNENFSKYKNIIFFMGSSGRKVLNETLKEWDLDYEEKKSLTNADSFILNIKKIKKKIS